MLELINLTKTYNNVNVVNNISLSVKRGEIFGLLGPNGAGKSTTVSMISTVLTPSGGSIIIDNKSLKDHPIEIKRIMGIVPQDLALYQALSAKENLSSSGVYTDLAEKS